MKKAVLIIGLLIFAIILSGCIDSITQLGAENSGMPLFSGCPTDLEMPPYIIEGTTITFANDFGNGWHAPEGFVNYNIGNILDKTYSSTIAYNGCHEGYQTGENLNYIYCPCRKSGLVFAIERQKVSGDGIIGPIETEYLGFTINKETSELVSIECC